MSITQDTPPFRAAAGDNTLTRMLTTTERREIKANPDKTYRITNDEHPDGSWDAKTVNNLTRVAHESRQWRIVTRAAKDGRRNVWISYDPTHYTRTPKETQQ